MVTAPQRWSSIPRRQQVATLVTMAFVSVFIVGRRWLFDLPIEGQAIVVAAAFSSSAFALSLSEVWSIAKPHPLPRTAAKSAFMIPVLMALFVVFVPPDDPMFSVAAVAALAFMAVAYELAYRWIVRTHEVDEDKMVDLYNVQQLRVGSEMPSQLRGAFAIVLLGAAVLGLSVGPFFLTLIPAVWMVARFVDPETPMDARFGRGIERIAIGGLLLAIAGMAWGLAVPQWHFGTLLGLSPLAVAVMGITGAAAATYGARWADRQIRAGVNRA